MVPKMFKPLTFDCTVLEGGGGRGGGGGGYWGVNCGTGVRANISPLKKRTHSYT